MINEIKIDSDKIGIEVIEAATPNLFIDADEMRRNRTSTLQLPVEQLPDEDDMNRLPRDLALPNYKRILAIATTFGIAACFGVGYGSGYGINELVLVHSNNNNAALVSSSKNEFAAYDDMMPAVDSKSSKAKSSKGGGKSGKSTSNSGDCFEATDGDLTRDSSDSYNGTLYDAVRDYVQNCATAMTTDCASAQKYGYPINNWCVGAVTSMPLLFSDFNSPVDMTGFNEDVSNWDVSSVDSMSSM